MEASPIIAAQVEAVERLGSGLEFDPEFDGMRIAKTNSVMLILNASKEPHISGNMRTAGIAFVPPAFLRAHAAALAAYEVAIRPEGWEPDGMSHYWYLDNSGDTWIVVYVSPLGNVWFQGSDLARSIPDSLLKGQFGPKVVMP